MDPETQGNIGELVNSEGDVIKYTEINRDECPDGFIQEAQLLVGSICCDENTMAKIEGIDEFKHIKEIGSMINGEDPDLTYYAVGKTELAILSPDRKLLLIDSNVDDSEGMITRICLCGLEKNDLASKSHKLLSITTNEINYSGKLLIQKWGWNSLMGMDIDLQTSFVYHNMFSKYVDALAEEIVKISFDARKSGDSIRFFEQWDSVNDFDKIRDLLYKFDRKYFIRKGEYLIVSPDKEVCAVRVAPDQTILGITFGRIKKPYSLEIEKAFTFEKDPQKENSWTLTRWHINAPLETVFFEFQRKN